MAEGCMPAWLQPRQKPQRRPWAQKTAGTRRHTSAPTCTPCTLSTHARVLLATVIGALSCHHFASTLSWRCASMLKHGSSTQLSSEVGATLSPHSYSAPARTAGAMNNACQPQLRGLSQTPARHGAVHSIALQGCEGGVQVLDRLRAGGPDCLRSDCELVQEGPEWGTLGKRQYSRAPGHTQQ